MLKISQYFHAPFNRAYFKPIQYIICNVDSMYRKLKTIPIKYLGLALE